MDLPYIGVDVEWYACRKEFSVQIQLSVIYNVESKCNFDITKCLAYSMIVRMSVDGRWNVYCNMEHTENGYSICIAHPCRIFTREQLKGRLFFKCNNSTTICPLQLSSLCKIYYIRNPGRDMLKIYIFLIISV